MTNVVLKQETEQLKAALEKEVLMVEVSQTLSFTDDWLTNISST